MMFRRISFFVFIFIFVVSKHAVLMADTIKVMHYNLLYYTTSVPSGCQVSAQYLDEKDLYLRKIIQYEKPDVFTVNEIGSQSVYVDRILNQVLNSNGVDYYRSCPLTNFSGGTIANMLYYDSRKLVYHSYFYISTSVRDINGYKMYYKTPQLSQGDTIFTTFIVAHLKAGYYDSDKQLRLTQVQALMNKLEQISLVDNFVFSGDFNLYSSSEPAYQHLINYSNTLFRLYDPINKPGEWNNNSQFAPYHTQSTHTYSSNGCYASGGMDDRFDFILVSPYVYYGSKKVKSINESYRAVGQDGQRFNGTIISPTNTVVPDSIAQALYQVSDHLPVVLQLDVNATINSIEEFPALNCWIMNPIEDRIVMEIGPEQAEEVEIQIWGIDGKLLSSKRISLEAGSNRIEFPFEYSSGFYLVRIKTQKGQYVTKKMIKK